MTITSRLLVGTLATAAALGGSALSAVAAHADEASGSLDDAASSEVTSALCPIASSGFIGTVLNGLNPESIARSCGGLHR